MQTKNKRDPISPRTIPALSQKFLSLAVALLLPPSVPPRLPQPKASLQKCLRNREAVLTTQSFEGFLLLSKPFYRPLPPCSPLLNSLLPTGLLSACPPPHLCRYSSSLCLECWPCWLPLLSSCPGRGTTVGNSLEQGAFSCNPGTAPS